MSSKHLDIVKSTGEKVRFSFSKLRRSLLKSGADKQTVNLVIDQMRDKLYQGMSTREIYNRAFSLLKQVKSVYASKYKLKKALYELGPSGFPFEKFVGKLFEAEGYSIEMNQIIQGRCVDHEVDVIAYKNSNRNLIECKFHSEEGRTCDVKIPLYINSRFRDIHEKEKSQDTDTGWLVTNTRFTDDALQYSKCIHLRLLSWDYPENKSLKDLIDKYHIYPLSVSTMLSRAEKEELLNKDLILASEVLENHKILSKIGIHEPRCSKILDEYRILTNTKSHEI
ncbi:ATPase [Gramella sp. BOM4]|nr:ATPase [Christiangramia bathymodioli]